MNLDSLEIKAQNKDQFLKSIQRFRKNQNETQKSLSEKAGIPQSSISKLELGTREPSLTLIFKVLSALGLEVVIRQKKKFSKDSKTEGIVI
jgi:HTH-type transcriptional regulator/antitoxin HipB